MRPMLRLHSWRSIWNWGSEQNEAGLPLDHIDGPSHTSIPGFTAGSRRAQSRFHTTSSGLSSSKTWWAGTTLGWRAGLLGGFIASAVVLIINIALLLLGAFSHGGYQSGIGTLAKGQSTQIERIGIAHHILVNTLSTILLTASNYCMQILCAPCRDDIDVAHAQGKWVDIGIISLHNLRFVGRSRAHSFVLLVLSSMPLHLFYNSAIFEVTMGQNYDVHYINGTDKSQAAILDETMHKLSNKDWSYRYDTHYVSDSGDIFLEIDAVGLEFSTNKSAWTVTPPASPYEWLPSSFSTTTWDDSPTIQGPIIADPVSATIIVSSSGRELLWPEPRFVNASEVLSIKRVLSLREYETGCWVFGSSNKSSTTIPPLRVNAAWVQPTPTNSKVQISLVFMVIVVVCNACKMFVIYWTYRRSFIPRVTTLGDAVSSFLERPDPAFAGICLLDRDEVILSLSARRNGEPDSRIPEWQDRSYRYCQSPMETRWLSKGIIIILTCIIFCLLLLILTMPIDKGHWGTSSTSSLWLAHQICDPQGILINAWLANISQEVLSFTYFTINRICTTMCSSREWNDYGITRKGLRVTSPAGHQRKAYFLQLPYRWAVPLTVSSGVLHWMASQAIFFSRLELRDAEGMLVATGSKCTTGFSALSAATLCGTFLAIGFTVLGLGVRKVNINMPLAGHCSMVIAAACHPPPGEVAPHLQAVQWGVVKNRFGARIDHCTFTGESVERPEVGKTYA